MLVHYLVALVSLLSTISFALPVQQQQQLQLQQKTAPKIKFVVFKTGHETEEQLAALPKVHAYAEQLGGLSVQEEAFPAGQKVYTSADGQTLHLSWMKIEKALAAMAASPDADWVLVFELSSLPTTDASAQIDFAALIAANPGISVFLKRSGLGFGMAMYRNQPATQKVLNDLWNKRSASGIVAAAFTSYTIWNPSLISQIKFL